MIIKFNKSSPLNKILEYVEQENPSEFISIMYKEGQYEILNTEIEDSSRFIGALERIKYTLLSGE